MNDRINDWLDGELPFDALDAREQAEARALEATILAAAERLREIPAPDVSASVLSRLPAVPGRAAPRPAAARAPGHGSAASLPSRVRAWAGALAPAGRLAPRSAAALVTLSLLIGFALGSLFPAAGPGASGPADAAVAAEPAPRLFVRFELEAAGATDVRLAGSFTGWEADIELTPLGDDRWTATVPLEPGVHDYIFVLDGDRHVVDPYAPRVSDGFGGHSSRLALLTPGS